MSGTASPKQEQSAKGLERTHSSSKKNRTQSAVVRQTATGSPFGSQTRPKSLYRHNKIYRGPPTPPPEVQFDRERSFILDCKAVSNISTDYSTANVKDRLRLVLKNAFIYHTKMTCFYLVRSKRIHCRSST
jgi:hypothetical protein